jgi:puromycin-sensitive aminopeptidase
MELAANEHYRPDWQVWIGFGTGKAAALSTDGLRSTRPVEFDVGRPEEAEAMFDVLTYQKGGAVLRMLEQYIGPETFRKGISHYLTIHAHANTETGDLWDAIEAVSGEPVRAIMDSWIFQGGYPLISVRAGEESTTVELSQRRFLYREEDGEARGGEACWAVPVNLRASVGGVVQRQRLLVDGTSASIDFDGPLDWVVVNDGAWGFYRVHYDTGLLARLLAAGPASVCDPLERMALVVDYWAGVVSGRTDLDRWVAVVESLGDEGDPDVWAAVSGALRLLDLMATGEEDRAALQAFVRNVAGPAWARLGWDPSPDETQRTGITRGRVLSALGLLGNDAAVGDEALARFRAFLVDKSGLAPDLLTPVAHLVAAWGGEEGWTSILEQYRAGTTPQDKVRYLVALTASRDPALLARTLDLAVGDEVRIQDGCFLIAEVMANRAGSALAWRWLEKHWDEIRGRFPPNLIARIMEGIASQVHPAVADGVHAFVASHDVPMAGPRVDQLLERMDINVALAARLHNTIPAALTG